MIILYRIPLPFGNMTITHLLQQTKCQRVQLHKCKWILTEHMKLHLERHDLIILILSEFILFMFYICSKSVSTLFSFPEI